MGASVISHQQSGGRVQWTTGYGTAHHTKLESVSVAIKKSRRVYMKRSITIAAALALAVSTMSCTTATRGPSGVQIERNAQPRSEIEAPARPLYTGRSPEVRSKVKPQVTAATSTSKMASPAWVAQKPASKFGATIITNGAAAGPIRMTQAMPTEATLGAEFAVDLSLTAQGDVVGVVMRNPIPANASYVRSEPAATVEGGQLVWQIGNMDAGQTRNARVWFKTRQAGALVNCATVSTGARVCGTTLVGKPVIAIDQSGPETAMLGSEVTYKIVFKNPGTGTVRNMFVTNPVPVGLSHASGKRELSFDLGDLAPGQAKPLTVTYKAVQRGQVCNTATANSRNAEKVSQNFCTIILAPGLKVETSGTKGQILGRNADYEIVISNPGDTTLRNVVVSDRPAAETSIVAAPGAAVSRNEATWNLAELKPGAKFSATLKLTSRVAGTYCNAVIVTNNGLSDSAKACTLWKGVAGVSLEVTDDPDPIQVGESTTYAIKVANQGSADMHNLKLVARFGDQVTPLSTAQGSISGKVVSLPAVAILGAKQSLSYTILVKGNSTGDSRNKITLTCEELKTPLEKEESTTVY